MNKKEILGIIKTTAILTVICVVITAALAVTNKFTKDRIDELSVANQQEAMQRIIKADEYKKGKVNYKGEETEFNVAVAQGETKGFIFTLNAKGYGGDVAVMTGIDTNGTVIAVEVTDAANETPGLGQNVAKEDFYNQYKGKTENIEVVKNGASGNQIQAVTGATISSNAVTEAVNESIEIYKTIEQSGGIG